MGRWMGVSPTGGIDDRGGIKVGGDLRILPPEHSRTVLCDQYHCVPVSGGGVEAGFKSGKAVVGAGQLVIGGDADGGSGGGTDGGGGEYGQDGDRDRDVLNWRVGYCSKINIRDGS